MLRMADMPARLERRTLLVPSMAMSKALLVAKKASLATLLLLQGRRESAEHIEDYLPRVGSCQRHARQSLAAWLGGAMLSRKVALEYLSSPHVA
mmetsp:Transcript_2619/g.7848  ORF Transcript_2619/g.7848 Transcript_2619/m.7848 type:complete len:94 (-) Transcript_2619:558-839(-)